MAFFYVAKCNKSLSQASPFLSNAGLGMESLAPTVLSTSWGQYGKAGKKTPRASAWIHGSWEKHVSFTAGVIYNEVNSWLIVLNSG